MGAFHDDLQRPDWVRGTRGWGSWASPLPNPTNFQQNPLDVTDAVAFPAERERERDEAAADMFLNWVYSTIGQGGFQDINWEPDTCHGPIGSIPSTCGAAHRPGFNRLTWMNTTMTDLLGLNNP